MADSQLAKWQGACEGLIHYYFVIVDMSRFLASSTPFFQKSISGICVVMENKQFLLKNNI